MLIRSRALTFTPQALAGLLALTGLVGCGAAGDQAGGTTQRRAVATAMAISKHYAAVQPTAPVATAGRRLITRATLQHRMEIGEEGRREVPEPPKYDACVRRLRLGQAASSSSEDMLTAECQHRYQALMAPVLTNAIDQLWVASEAAELGIHLDKLEVERELTRQVKDPAFVRALQKSGETLSDVRLQLGLNQLTDRIFQSVDATKPKPTQFQLARYYKEHEAQFFIPQEQRDLHIVRTTTKVAAMKALGWLKSRQSFANVVKRVAVGQPIGAVDGLFLGLTPQRFVEQDLARAIFRAHPGELVGPVKITLGYYDFEVTKLHSPRQRTLAEAEPGLRKALPGLLKNQHLASFVRAFRKKWTARTDCRPGFIVENCRQYKGPVVAPKDPYAL